jgi:sugar transferase (PEP-CTERM system associated)
MFSQQTRYKQLILFLGDFLIIICSLYLSVFIRFLNYINVIDIYTGATLFFIFAYHMLFYIFDLYNLSLPFKSAAFFSRLLLAVIIATLVVAISFYLFPSWKFGRGIYLINVILIFSLTYSWRLAFHVFFSIVDRPKNIAIVGAGYAGETICNILNDNNDYVIKSIFDDNPDKLNENIYSYPVTGPTSQISELAEKGEIDSVVIAVIHDRNPELLNTIIHAKMNGVEIYDMASLYEELTGKLPVLHLTHGWMAYTPFHGIRRGLYTSRMKKIIDICLSITGLILASPLMLITAVAIKIDTKGPVLYRQKRVGFNERIYDLIKFRSMAGDAEIHGAFWAQENDSRITRIGNIIRKTRFDEIPQLWNILKGDMSLIGPRPERPEFVKKLEDEIPFYTFRHAVKPGITGWAQVNYRYGASKDDTIEKLQYDLFYIKNLSVFLDLQILFKTLRVILFRKGAR